MSTSPIEQTMPTWDTVVPYMRALYARVTINCPPLRSVLYSHPVDRDHRISVVTVPHMAVVSFMGATYAWQRTGKIQDAGLLFSGTPPSAALDGYPALSQLVGEPVDRRHRAFRWDGQLFRAAVIAELGDRYEGKLRAWVDQYVLAVADDEHRAKQAADTFEFEALANPLRDLVDNLGDTGCYSLSPSYAWAVYIGRYAMRELG